MILPESQPFEWNEEEWRKHIESVVRTVGSYENDRRRVRRTGLERLAWAVDHREGSRWSTELYDSLDDAIYDFMSLEELPILDGAAKSADYGMRSQLASDSIMPETNSFHDAKPQSQLTSGTSQLTSETKSADFGKSPEQSQPTLFAAESRVKPEERREIAQESEEDMGYYAEYEIIQRQVYHVVPAEKGWEVKKEGNKRPSAKTGLKAEAVAEAKRLAKKAKLGQVIVHKKDGKIQTEYTYGKDPRETKG